MSYAAPAIGTQHHGRGSLCACGTRGAVSTIVGMIAEAMTVNEIISDFPQLVPGASATRSGMQLRPLTNDAKLLSTAFEQPLDVDRESSEHEVFDGYLPNVDTISFYLG